MAQITLEGRQRDFSRSMTRASTVPSALTRAKTCLGKKQLCWMPWACMSRSRVAMAASMRRRMGRAGAPDSSQRRTRSSIETKPVSSSVTRMARSSLPILRMAKYTGSSVGMPQAR